MLAASATESGIIRERHTCHGGETVLNESTMPDCVIALGGNVGDVRATFMSALRDLDARGIAVLASSHHYQTRPIGPSAGSVFWNAAFLVRTALSPESLLQLLHEVEARHGRERAVVWGPRTLDLDLILYGTEVIDTPMLQVPHPACWYRRFVLDPIIDLSPGREHPVFGQTFVELRARLLQHPLPIRVEGPDAAAFIGELQARFVDRLRVAAAGETPAITFHRRSSAAGQSLVENPATVVLAGPTLADDVATAGFVLSAALDEPRPVD
jgi:2-amino-4-hydroxy-6-hydroxymethyldihydropteridine diphosphokinase